VTGNSHQLSFGKRYLNGVTKHVRELVASFYDIFMTYLSHNHALTIELTNSLTSLENELAIMNNTEQYTVLYLCIYLVK
jgi:hypothetical protein